MPSTVIPEHRNIYIGLDLSVLTDKFMFGEMALKWTAKLAAETTRTKLGFFPRSVDLSPLSFY